MSHATRPGDVLADRYRLVDLLSESGNGRFWRAHDRVLERHVALHVIGADDERAEGLLEAARRSATVLDQRILRVLDAERRDDICYVVNEWGSGTSLDIMLATNGPLSPRRGAWMVAEVADSLAVAHAHGVAHGRLVPENVLVDTNGAIRIIGFCVDAALFGLPPGTFGTDVRDLVGLLHASLTGRWAGASVSIVPEAPRDHGRVMRPRQVRAGVPRSLDDLCDEVLNPRGSRIRDVRDHGSARGVHAFLTQFVGDPTGLSEAIAADNPDKHETLSLPAVPEIPARPDPMPLEPEPVALEPDAEAEPPSDPEPEPDPEPVAATELPTEAGLPIFDEETDEVSWLRARSEKPPPPPPFEEPPERPLFAPEPEDGGPPRKARSPQPVATLPGRRDEYWPWDPSRSSGSGTIPAYDPDGEEPGHVPGRNWLRLAALIALALVLLVAIAIAFNVGRGKTPLGAEPESSPSTSESENGSATPPELEVITGVTAEDFDPQGADPQDENPEDVANAVDGDPETSWSTASYDQQFGPGGLKTGVGLVLDLGESQDVAQVDLTLVGEPTGLSLYLTDEPPSSVDGLDPLTEVTAGPEESITLDEPTTGRYLTLWLTRLPPTDDGRFRGEVVDVVVQG